MSFNLIIIKQSPYQGRQSHEILEAIMSLALFDIDHRVVFFEQGISWLFAQQAPADQKSLEKQLSALPLYGSEQLYYCQEHHLDLFPDQQPLPSVQPVSAEELALWCRQAQHVEVF
ncbi:DsrE family protein [Reinekea sp.]|jgi:sulfur relay (sulfurtransferase) DsrF/TusC family protein|uniref:DsrE family protein n=1 Tax=Reinekea sp. TaxID=1970455 RepID=UPI002A8331D4|nr:DsrE family protein [Reinekea sp.]